MEEEKIRQIAKKENLRLLPQLSFLEFQLQWRE